MLNDATGCESKSESFALPLQQSSVLFLDGGDRGVGGISADLSFTAGELMQHMWGVSAASSASHQHIAVFESYQAWLRLQVTSRDNDRRSLEEQIREDGRRE